MNSRIENAAPPVDGASRENWLWLAGITTIHAALLAVAVFGIEAPAPKLIPPRIIGMLVSDLPAVAINSPKQTKPEIHQAKTTPNKMPTLPPTPKAPASERAVTAPATPTAHSPAPASASSGQISLPRTDAEHANNPKPVYPSASRRTGEQGRVLLSVYILPDGSVGEIKLKQSSGHNRLDQSALDAVRRWHFVPARRGNEPIPFWYVQPISFSLDA